MASDWQSGNAEVDGADRRGWLVGHFVSDSDDLRATKDVEIKWGIHPADEARADWSTDEYRTTVVLLVRGRFHVTFPSGSALLAAEGDYVLWGPGVDHSWQAEADSVVITIRWPSLP